MASVTGSARQLWLSGIVAMLFCFVVCGCSSPQPKVVGGVMLLKNIGRYTNYPFDLDINEFDGIVMMSISHAKLKEKFSDRVGSKFGRWTVCLDGTNTIWVHGGDGIYCLQLQDDSHFSKTWITTADRSLIQQMPSQFYDQLGSSYKKSLSSLRKTAK